MAVTALTPRYPMHSNWKKVTDTEAHPLSAPGLYTQSLQKWSWIPRPGHQASRLMEPREVDTVRKLGS